MTTGNDGVDDDRIARFKTGDTVTGSFYGAGGLVSEYDRVTQARMFSSIDAEVGVADCSGSSTYQHLAGSGDGQRARDNGKTPWRFQCCGSHYCSHITAAMFAGY